MPPAARVTDQTSHGTPLTPGIGSLTVSIGFKPAWRALPVSVASAVESVSNAVKDFMQSASLNPAKAKADIAKILQGLGEAAGNAASEGNPAAVGAAAASAAALGVTDGTLTTAWTAASAVPGGQPAADKAYTEGIKAAMATAASAVFASIGGMTDTHICPIPCPIPPHGPGVVTKGSKTVVIDNLPACRQGDKVFEACGGEDPIALGEVTVLIGDDEGSPAGPSAPPPPAEPSPDEQVRQSVVEAMTSQGPATVADPSPDQVGPLTPEEEEPDKPTWIGVRLKDFNDEPIINEDVLVTLDDGQVLSGRTNEEGYVEFKGIQPAQGEVSFVKIPDDQEKTGRKQRGRMLDEERYTREADESEAGEGAESDEEVSQLRSFEEEEEQIEDEEDQNDEPDEA